MCAAERWSPPDSLLELPRDDGDPALSDVLELPGEEAARRRPGDPNPPSDPLEKLEFLVLEHPLEAGTVKKSSPAELGKADSFPRMRGLSYRKKQSSCFMKHKTREQMCCG